MMSVWLSSCLIYTPWNSNFDLSIRLLVRNPFQCYSMLPFFHMEDVAFTKGYQFTSAKEPSHSEMMEMRWPVVAWGESCLKHCFEVDFWHLGKRTGWTCAWRPRNLKCHAKTSCHFGFHSRFWEASSTGKRYASVFFLAFKGYQGMWGSECQLLMCCSRNLPTHNAVILELPVELHDIHDLVFFERCDADRHRVGVPVVTVVRRTAHADSRARPLTAERPFESEWPQPRGARMTRVDLFHMVSAAATVHGSLRLRVASSFGDLQSATNWALLSSAKSVDTLRRRWPSWWSFGLQLNAPSCFVFQS